MWGPTGAAELFVVSKRQLRVYVNVPHQLCAQRAAATKHQTISVRAYPHDLTRNGRVFGPGPIDPRP